MTEAEKIQYWKRYARQTTIYERSGAVHFQLAINKTINPVIKHIAAHGVESALLSIDILVDRKIIEQAFTDFYVHVAKKHKLWADQELKRRLARKKDRLPTVNVDVASADAGLGIGFFNPEWLRKLKNLVYGLKAAQKVTQVTNTIKKKLRAVLGRAVKEEVRPSVIAKRIQSEMDSDKFSARRSKVIARTEATYIANQAAKQSAIETMELTGLVLKKIWIDTRDDRVRDTHWINPHPIGFNEKFVVGDSLMDVPGDPDGEAKEVIQCRCAVSYIPAEDHEDIFPTI
ncbi:phage minor head protein [Dyadobacter sp. CY351]|uniref:phage minor head protein n=1 Tax=Dyadobacter sp. CY351 TaxID=2909337 RepID=UPI001F47E4F4|nr:phage minor head protein [Dyadobacter sp. CY351]MCF2517136.1 phage head morphogenesis protein [Dyadobacter sp. CY351]